jgi:hypothetical protein
MDTTSTARARVDLPLLARHATALLEAGVPLTLLIDLAEPGGPHSQDVYVAERGSADWLMPTR